MRILYIGHGAPESTSRHRADALARLGHEVIVADPYAALAGPLRGRLRGALHYRSGYRLLQGAACAWVDRLLRQHAAWPEMVWVNGGELIGAAAANKLRQLGAPVVLYNNDDPTGKRDGRRFDSLQAALPAYDLCAVLREPNVGEFYAHGARSVHRVWMSYDEVLHRPFESSEEIPAAFRSEVAFIGTWIPGERRDEFMLSLVKRGVPLSIWGDAWQRSPNWPQIKHVWRGQSIYGRNYVAAVQGSKLALGLLSKGNRDLHTTRSAEIPYAGGLLCAQRTSEHLAMYKEGEEAVFWESADECAAVCSSLLADPTLRERIRASGKRRSEAGGFGNEAILSDIIQRLLAH
ncbi:MAG: glycosyltransferase [Pseudomonadota bacterium]